MASGKDNGARMMRNLLSVVSVAAVCMVTWLCLKGCTRRGDTPAVTADTVSVVRDTVVVRDTLYLPSPVAREERQVGTAVATVPTQAPVDSACGRLPDSVRAVLPMVQRHYGDSLYDAWVSGPAAGDARPALDSIRLYPRHTTVRETVTTRAAPRRWGFSVGAGIVASPTRIEPGIFIGVTYTFATL